MTYIELQAALRASQAECIRKTAEIEALESQLNSATIFAVTVLGIVGLLLITKIL